MADGRQLHLCFGGLVSGFLWQMLMDIWSLQTRSLKAEYISAKTSKSIGLVLSCLEVHCGVATPPMALYHFLTAYGKHLVEEGGVLEREWLRCRCAA